MVRRPSLRCALLALCTVAVPAAATDGGMWMPQQIPAIAGDLKQAGLAIDPAQLNDLTGFPMGAIVSLKGCSASFVSPDGLIATNHHCIYSALQYNSTPERDLIEHGFLARRHADELPARPDARVLVTTALRDVTEDVLGAAGRAANDGERAELAARRRKELVAACEEKPGVKCQVKAFFGGEQFWLFEALEIRDVRLVYSPALGVGNFGDEEDNWMWPRHTGDFGFLRAYVGKDGKAADPSPQNVPYRPQHHLKVSTRDIDPGDFMMIAGYPGTTHRLDAATEIADAEQFEMPTSIRYREALLAELAARDKKDRAVAIKNATRVASLENYLKKHSGTLAAMQRDRMHAGKVAEEKAVRAELAKSLGGEAAAARLLADLDAVFAARRATRERDAVLEWLDTASPMLSQSAKLVRLAHERGKTDLERKEGYQERDLAELWQSMERTQRSIEPGSDRAGLRIFLLEATRLPADQRIAPLDRELTATGASGAEAQVDALLDRLYAGTAVGDLARRKAMFAMSAAELAATKDSMVDFARALFPQVQEVDERNGTLEGALMRLRPAYVAALRAARDGKLAPDANGTLRFTYGQVAAVSPRDGVSYAPQTTVAGIVEKDTGVRPFDSPKRLLEASAAKRYGAYVDPELGTLPVNYISTNSVTNGSSGSATLNAWGELAGLAFDTNLEAVAADYLFDPRIVRTISVDSRYMLWVMEAVDGAVELLRELDVAPRLEVASPPVRGR